MNTTFAKRIARIEDRAGILEDNSCRVVFKPSEGASPDDWAEFERQCAAPGRLFVVSFIESESRHAYA